MHSFGTLHFYPLKPRSYDQTLHSTIIAYDSITESLISHLGIGGSTLPTFGSTIKTPGSLSDTKVLQQDLGFCSQKCRIKLKEMESDSKFTVKAELELAESLTPMFGIKPRFFIWKSNF